MGDAGLKIVISGEVAQGIAAVKSFATELTKTGAVSAEVSAKISGSLGTIPDAAEAGGQSIDKLANKLKQMQLALGAAQSPGYNLAPDPVRIKALESAIASLQSRMASAQGTGKAFNASLNELTAEVAFFGGGVKNTNTAALAYVSSIKSLTPASAGGAAALKDLSVQAATSGNAFNKIVSGVGGAYGAIRKLAYILPGIGVAGIIGAITEGIVSIFSTSSKETEKSVSELQKNIRSLSTVQNEAIGGTSGQIAQVSALAAVITDANKPYEERKRALQELKEVNKSYFGDLSLESDKMGVLKKAVDDYTQAIVQQAVIKGFSDEISKVSVALSNQQDVVDKAKLKYHELSKAAQETADNQKKIQQSVIGGSSLGLSSDVSQTPLAFKKAADALKNFTDQQTGLDKLSFQFAALNDKVVKATESSLKLKDLQTPAKGQSPESALNKEISGIKAEISALEELQKQGDITHLEIQKLFSLKIKLIEVELPKSKLTPEQAGRLITNLQNDADLALASHPIDMRISLGKILTGDAFSRSPVDTLKKLFDTDKALKSLTLEPKVTLRPEILIPDDFFNKTGVRFEEAVKKINDIVKNAAIDGIVSISSGLGEALAGTGNPLQGFLTTLGDGLKQLGVYLITISPIIAAIKLALKSLNPALMLPAGIALVAIGAAVKSKVSKTTAFAEGGIVTGPTNALIGERGPEVVFPLRELNKFVQGMGGRQDLTLLPTVQFSGDMFRIMLNNIDRRRARV